MTYAPPVSVVVVSRGRPDALARCLTALTQLYYPTFEIVVIADGPGLNRVDMIPALFGRIKTSRFDDANISLARNLGITRAAGEIVAFIDDDAVPEPNWLDQIVASFDDDRVMSAGGTVIGRNGFSVQWGPRCIHATGRCDPVDAPGPDPVMFSGRPGLGIKTEGTNMAIRRDLLAKMGGFDPAFRFYLDESDLNLRLATEFHAAALVPGAIVHHGFEPSDKRRADRVPLTLFEVGASLSVFLRKHAQHIDHPEAIATEREERRRGLLGHMVAGRIEPRDVRRILATFDAGLADGRLRPIDVLPPLPQPIAPFLRFPSEDVVRGNHVAHFGRRLSRTRVLTAAKQAAADGYVTTALVLSPDARPHKLVYQMEGFWLQWGGQFGRADRGDSAFRVSGFRSRVEQELRKAEANRGRTLMRNGLIEKV